MNYKYFSLAFGFSVWLVATLMVRFWGHALFVVNNNYGLTTLFLGTIPLLYVLAQLVYRNYDLNKSKRMESAVFMAVPGMLCDVGCLRFHEVVFPKLTMEQSMVLAIWVIWSYGIVLLTGISKK